MCLIKCAFVGKKELRLSIRYAPVSSSLISCQDFVRTYHQYPVFLIRKEYRELHATRLYQDMKLEFTMCSSF
jgi:hypothetical protein